MENKDKVADNWACGNALERFKQVKIDDLEKRVEIGDEYISSKKFQGLLEVKKRIANSKLEKLKEELLEMRKIYDAVYILIIRHEHVIDVLARIYMGMNNSILSKGKFPKELMEEQVKIMQGYYESLKKILEPCKLD